MTVYSILNSKGPFMKNAQTMDIFLPVAVKKEFKHTVEGISGH